ncbi:hypothetical protein BD289DRAFT_482077 [Coniella lustricola]|uniref:Uncharacterized protein n=1 Tax=Coniella lustricola TaxID=2025994 RepID=A0A2T3AA64_9PEZI|nr:hypothetical protein BD289DRAFT_482077 [Coniella lustricola]
MAIQIKTKGSSASPPNTRWRSVVVSTLLVLVVLGSLYSQTLILDEDPYRYVRASQKLHTNQAIFDPANGRDRPLILFAYAESENARDNLKFFLKRGLHAAADFIFIFNGETDASDLVPTSLANVKVVKRENTCYDIGAFGQVLAKDALWQRYKRFITLNASVRGPFLPVWSDECWSDAFFNKLSDKVKLVGLTYHCVPNPHVQSMLLATDRVGMEILLDPLYAGSVPLDTPPWGGAEIPVGYSVCYNNYAEAVGQLGLFIPRLREQVQCHLAAVSNNEACSKKHWTNVLFQVHGEIGMARLIRSQGYDVDVMLTSVHSYTPAEYCDKLGPLSDHLSPNNYFGSNVHPYEVIFAKANRGIDDELLGHLTDWHYQMNDTSWEKCGGR